MTAVDEVADGIYRISSPLQVPGGGFTFNQYLVVDDQPLLFHTGPRRLFQATLEAIARVLDPASLRYIAFSHYEADECGALNELLAAAARAEPVCSSVAAMTSIGDQADRPPKAMRDGEELVLGRHRVRWFDTPHLPHGWECGYLHEQTTATLFCGDLFTQPGDRHLPLTEGDILGPSEEMRSHLDYWAHSTNTRALLDKLAAVGATTLACMHGSAWRGDSPELLDELGKSLGV